ncbi:MAG: 2-C-methyl-D-erythritol 2,4-cyclodiphosphate synthase [Candidatus Omnitrophica bacterium]|nr:2-C-methyl-D-erythritol 2,4-cyclodiphosphate synthase [Candidatus Omnitrophota bacterium]
MKVSAILTAAGSGSRLKQTVSNPLKLPKAFWPLGAKTVLNCSLKSLIESRLVSEIVIVVPDEFVKRVEREVLAEKKKIRVVRGASSRVLSVFEGLKRVSRDCDFVLVHDAARPLITTEGVDQVIRAALKSGAAIAAKPVASTIKESKGSRIVTTVPRETLWEAETPQVVKHAWLIEGYKNFFKNPFSATDEAGLLEFIGRPVNLVALTKNNLKVTTGQDLEIAQKMLNGPVDFRIGHGSDIHRLVAGRQFILGGEKLKSLVGPLGHSDGDALLHALSDAILGAAGLGDIGDYFSDTNQRYKNISSSKILEAVMKLAHEKNWRLENADCIIHLEKPKLGTSKSKIRNRIAKILSISPDAVNIKAKTREGLGEIGSGSAIACEATVLLKKVSR